MVSIGFEPWTAGRKALTDPLGKIYLFVLKIGPFITTKFLIQFFCKIFLLITKHNITDNVYIRLIVYIIYTDIMNYTFNQL